ncbi:hypothetical protein NQ314_002439 [Rhamnusium bicolor]|uniref:Telomerase reverse transcriptase n=1 Tax=Rhamnusium bicolor TaxID=1586634 RepID=A0AAV8ZSN3_9CUCU|nr:hypothetical protein NQ314_002439 [Rhamnusium bicolor]
MVYYQLSLDRKLRKIWKREKWCRKLKQKRSAKPFEIMLNRICERSRRIKILESVYSEVKITKILDEVIGNDYFGTTQNRKRFYHLVNKIITQSRFECVYKSVLSKGYNINSISWLQEENLDEKGSRALLEKTNLYILRFVVKPLIKHFYHALKSFRGYEVKFIERRKWHSFQHTILNELLHLKFLTLPSGTHISRGILRLFPKTNCDSLEYRPLISLMKYNRVTKEKFKRISKMINFFSRDVSRIEYTSVFASWKKYTEVVKGQQIYGIKLDIKDAFGNVNIDKVCEIIKQSTFKDQDKQFIIKHVQSQYISFNKKLYRWNHGLLQGDCLDTCFLHRMADDYFFCSTEKSDIDKFEFKVKSMFQLTEAKTERADGSGECVISYFGQIFNLNSRQVSKLYSFKKDSSIRHKFKFWNIKYRIPEISKQNIVSRTLRFMYNNHCFKKLELNTSFNTEETVLINYFEGMVFIAFKYEAAVMAIREFQQEAEDMPFLISLLENVIYGYSNTIFLKIQCCKGSNHTGNISFRLLKNIAYRAFILVLRKNNEFYKSIIRYIKNKNNLYLYLDKFKISPNIFTKLPQAFEDICLGRRSEI